MKFPLHGKIVVLQGIRDDLTSCKPVSQGKLKGLLRRKVVSHMVNLRKISAKNDYPPIHSVAPSEDQLISSEFDYKAL